MTDASRLPLPDRSRYYKGLLVLARRDHQIDEREREFMLLLGQVLDFDARFCESAIAELLQNRHITDEPVTFAAAETARDFLRDAVRLARVDHEISRKELSWLRAVAGANGVSEEWLEDVLRGGEEAGGPQVSTEGLALRKCAEPAAPGTRQPEPAGSHPSGRG